MEKLSTIMNDALGEYNEQHIPMNLVLFGDAMAQVCRICRVLRQPGGNSLLLGVGGSGRQSLARLATHIADMQLFQIEITKNYRVIEWREDLKNLLKLAGMEFKQVVFLFTDTQAPLIDLPYLSPISPLHFPLFTGTPTPYRYPYPWS